MARGALIRVVAAAVLALGAIATVFAIDATSASGVPKPRYEVDTSTECVLPAEQMRVRHMALLMHQRDRTVRQGVRGDQVSLNECVSCHAGPGAGISAGAVVGSETAFCESCHRYAGVKLDCFECHQAKAAPAAAAAGPREQTR